MMNTILFFLTILAVTAMQAVAGDAQRVATGPSTPFDFYTLYVSLAFFWIVIIGLLVIIRIKLKELKRTRNMGLDDKNDVNAPFLD